MCRSRNLEQTPGLIDADVADDIRRMHAAISVPGNALEVESTTRNDNRGATRTQVQHNGTVEGERVV